MANKELFWIKPKGEILIDKKPWNRKEPLPLGKLSKEFIQKNLEKGFIGEKIGTSEILTSSSREEIEMLTKENEKLRNKIKALSSKGANDPLKKENEELKLEIETLKEEIQGLIEKGDK